MLPRPAPDRLPWQYGAAQGPAADALRLREALLPYTYTLGWQAHDTGLPMTRPLYLDYPDLDAAYNQPDEYLYGPNVLVAPVTSPGDITTSHIWFPPGRWVDFYTGATYTGPASVDLQVPLNRMPVFVKAGGIVPEQTGQSHVNADPSAPLTLKIYSGASGDFTLYSDAGDGTRVRQRPVHADAGHLSRGGQLAGQDQRGQWRLPRSPNHSCLQPGSGRRDRTPPGQSRQSSVAAGESEQQFPRLVV